MEYLDGETLAQKLKKGRMPLDQALHLAIEIAGALDHAHRHGVTHRDLKPANIMLTKAGAKVLDFGVAKVRVMDAAAGRTQPTNTLTEEGTLLGTLQYMAPEQLEGKEADARTDIFAFGAVLYEMLTERKAFEGSGQLSLISAILTAEPPPVSLTQRLAAPLLDQAVKKCLAKDPAERWQSAADLAGALRWIAPDSAPIKTHSRRAPWPVWAGLAPSAVVAAAAFAFWWGGSNTARAPGLSVPSALGQISSVARITAYPGDERAPSLSPDGTHVAFSWTGDQGANRNIYVTRIGGPTPLRLTWEDAEDNDPAWSPDGSQIAFIRQYDALHAAIILVPALGGLERKLYAGRFKLPNYGVSRPVLCWSPDGKSIVFPLADDSGGGILTLLSLDTGQSHALTPRVHHAGFDSSPAISPDSEWLAFTRYHASRNGEIMVQRLAVGLKPLGEPFVIPGSGQSPRSLCWAPDAKHLVFIDDMRVLDWRRGGTVQVAYALNGSFAESSIVWRRGGARMVAASTSSGLHIWALPIDPRTHEATGPATRWARSPMYEEQGCYSPDGRYVAFVSDRSGTVEVWLADASGENSRQLTRLGSYIAGFARWSRDGQQIAFHARIPDTPQLYVVDVDSGVPRRITNAASGLVAPSWSLDGKHLYANTRGQLYRLLVEDGSMEELFEGVYPVETMDGKRLLYSKRFQLGIFSRSLEGDPRRNPEQRIVDDFSWVFGGYLPVSSGFFYTSCSRQGKPNAFRFFDYAQGRAKDIAPAPHNITLGLAVSPDQRRLLFSAAGEEGSGYDLLMLEFQGTDEARH